MQITEGLKRDEDKEAKDRELYSKAFIDKEVVTTP